MSGYVVAAGLLAVALVVLAVLVWDTPVGLTRAIPGRRYRIGGVEHTVPALRLSSSTPRLIRESVLEQMAGLLEYTDRTLTEHGIAYWVSCGTLLGAVRHQGFIPWDDDIDLQVEMTERAKLLDLRERFLKDGFVLINAGGGYKLAYNTVWRFPFVDLVMVARDEGRMKLCYPLAADGTCTFGKAREWPNECIPIDQVFPLVRVPFESFAVSAPGRTVDVVTSMYGSSALAEARCRFNFLPWILNHRTDSVLLKLGLTEG
jgi:hypothetical protein